MTTDPHDATRVSLPELTKPMRNSKHWDQGVDWPLAGERAARLEREDQLRDALKRAADAEAQVKALKEVLIRCDEQLEDCVCDEDNPGYLRRRIAESFGGCDMLLAARLSSAKGEK